MKKKIFYEIFMRFLTLSIRDSNLGFTDSFGHPKRNDVPITAKSDWKIANTAVTCIKRFLLFTGQSVLHPSFVPEQRTCESNLTVPPSYIQLKLLFKFQQIAPQSVSIAVEILSLLGLLAGTKSKTWQGKHILAFIHRLLRYSAVLGRRCNVLCGGEKHHVCQYLLEGQNQPQSPTLILCSTSDLMKKGQLILLELAKGGCKVNYKYQRGSTSNVQSDRDTCTDYLPTGESKQELLCIW